MRYSLSRHTLMMVGIALLAVAGVHFGYVDAGQVSMAGLLGITMNTAAARVVDPILSTVAQGYKNADFVGMNLFPYVPVGQRGGKILTFGKEDFRLYATARAPGTNTKRIQYGYSGAPFALEQHALEGIVAFEHMEEADAVPGIDLGRGAVVKVQNTIGLRLEYAQAQLATTAGNYAASNKVTLAGTGQWSDYTGTSDPINDIEAGKDAVRSKIGKRPNTLILGPTVWSKVRNHPKLIERIKYTGRDGLTLQQLAESFGVKNVFIGDAVYADAADNFVDVWGKYAVLAFTETAGLAEQGTPSYGYTYRLGGYPIVEQPYQDRNAKSWIYPVTDEVSPVIAGALGGYLISAAVA